MRLETLKPLKRAFHLEVEYIRADRRLPSMRIPVRRHGGEPYIPRRLHPAAGDRRHRPPEQAGRPRHPLAARRA